MIEAYGWGDNKGNSERIQKESVGKEIKKVSLTKGDSLRIIFVDGTGIEFFDDGQDCCEYRYMSVDGDDLSEFVGARYVDSFIKDAPDIETEYDVHEVQFLEVKTSKGSITVSSHNEHNGYYGGFNIVVKEVKE